MSGGGDDAMNSRHASTSVGSRNAVRSAPTFQSVTPPMRLGSGNLPVRDQRQTVEAEIENKAATTGSLT